MESTIWTVRGCKGAVRILSSAGSLTIKRFLMLLAMTLLPAGAAQAGDSLGTVGLIYVMSGDVSLFLAGPHANKPACSRVGDEWAFPLSTSGGRGMLAMLLAAQSQGKQVRVIGSGVCSAWSDREAPSYIILLP